MLDIKKKYGFDKDKAKAGVKMVIGTDPETDYLMVKRIPSDEYFTLLNKTFQDNAERLTELKEVDPEAAKDLDVSLQSEVMAKTVIAGWGPGIQEDDKVVEFTVENCVKLLKEYVDLRIEVMGFARNNANYPPKMNVEKVKKR